MNDMWLFLFCFILETDDGTIECEYKSPKRVATYELCIAEMSRFEEKHLDEGYMTLCRREPVEWETVQSWRK